MKRYFGLAMALGILPAGALAQGVLPDVLGQVVGQAMNTAWPENCLALRWEEKPRSVERFALDAEPSLRAYLDLAAAGADPSPAYKRNWQDRWMLDGVGTQDLSTIRDPWAGRVARIETVGIMLGRGEVFGHGVWRAYAADGALLGTYEAEMIRKTRGYAIGALRLWSPGQENNVRAIAPYCARPGDHEAWLAAQAAADAETERRRAEREARRRR